MGRCDQCRRQRYRELYATTRNGHNDRAWREFRLTILRRDNYTCYAEGCYSIATEANLDELTRILRPTRVAARAHIPAG